MKFLPHVDSSTIVLPILFNNHKEKKKDENIKNGLWHTPLPPFSFFLYFLPSTKEK
jgi:hypothetical protein